MPDGYPNLLRVDAGQMVEDIGAPGKTCQNQDAMTTQKHQTPPLIAIVAVPESSGAVLYGLFEVLSTFGAAWAEVMGEAENPAAFDVRVVAASSDPFTCVGGVPVTPHASLREVDYADVVIITDLAIKPDTSHDHKWPEVKRWLNDIYHAGGTVCSVCSGSVLLAGSGLLDHKPATTHSAYVPNFRRFYPQVQLEAGRLLVPVGEGYTRPIPPTVSVAER